MKMRTRFDCSRTARRSGFTLIELMIVITIIVSLMALSAGAVMKVMEMTQTSGTQSTLDNLQSQLGRAWSKVKDEAYYKSNMTEIVPGVGIPVSQWILTNLAQVGASDPNAKERVRVIYVKLRLRQAFPMSFAEAINPFPLPPLPGYFGITPTGQYNGYLGNLGITPATPYILDPATGLPDLSHKYESSICLLMALQRGASGAGIKAEDVTGGGRAGIASTTGGPGGNTIPYITDAWSRPIFFARFPAGSLYLNPPAGLPAPVPNNLTMPWGPVTCFSRPGANDPGDPQGYLQSPSWGTSPMGPAFSALTLQVLAAGNTSYKLAPMVASGGPYNWLKTGVIPPFDPITFYAPPGSGAIFSTP